MDAYQVLARKYRPQTFEDLIGQEAMARTLANAFESGRIAHAFMLTGVRGVGKTTTARLLARALNYRPKDGQGEDGPSLDLAVYGEECAAIAASSHPDVMEMDAASRTGVGDIREILDGVRYAPTRARYKVYIIDEVHMLSTNAFNALLKTLEEPPAHAKFIFATTEARKVPVTVLSRCQRFDLKRVDPDRLTAHLAAICAKENARVEEDGLRLIARAAEGSVRDALSILDQAIVQAAGDPRAAVGVDAVRAMLGVADRGRTVEVLAAVLVGDGAAASQDALDQHEGGADPVALTRDLMDHCHAITRAKALGEAARFTDAADYVARVRALADATSMGHLTRVWQMLLKAHEEVRAAPDPIAALEMALLRMAYAASLPPPEDAARLLAGAGNAAASAPEPAAAGENGSGPRARLRAVEPIGEPVAEPRGESLVRHAVATAAPEPTPTPDVAAEAAEPDAPALTWLGIIALAEERRELMLKSELERTARPVRVEPGRVVFQPTAQAKPDLSARLARSLQDWTGARWLVAADAGSKGGETAAEARARAEAERLAAVKSDPLVQEALRFWPDAEIVSIRDAASGEDSVAGDGADAADDEDASDTHG